MTTITHKELISMSLSLIINYLKAAFLDWQIKQIDRHMESLARSIANDRQAIAHLQHERMLLAVRRRGES